MGSRLTRQDWFFIVVAMLTFVFSADASAGAVDPLAKDFKLGLTAGWKRMPSRAEGVAVFATERRDRVIAVKVFKQQGSDAPGFLKNYLKHVSDLRAKLLLAYGLKDYALIEHRHRPAQKGWAAYDTIQARFLGLDAGDRQSLERQFAWDGKMYVVTYIEKSATLLNRDRAEAALDMFRPKISTREPASARTGVDEIGSGRSTRPQAQPASATQRAAPQSPTREECQALGLKADEIITPEERLQQTRNVVPDWRVPAYCLKGAIWNLFEEIGGMLVDGYRFLRDPAAQREFLDQTNASQPTAVAVHDSDDPKVWLGRIAANLGAAASQRYNRFLCLKPHLQVERVCELVSYLFGAVKLLPKLIAHWKKIGIAAGALFTGTVIVTVIYKVMTGERLTPQETESLAALQRLIDQGVIVPGSTQEPRPAN